MMTNDKPENLENDREQCRELVCALADGQLRGLEFARAVDLVNASGDARATWHAYHVAGDVLRSGDAASCADDAAFIARFQTRLRREISDLMSSDVAPDDLPNGVPDAANTQGMIQGATNTVASYANTTRAAGTNGIDFLQIESANESRFRWKLLAGVASVAAVGAIGWSMVGGLNGLGGAGRGDGMREGTSPLASQLAQNSAPPQPPVMIRDPHLDALLAAHKQFGGTSALQMPAGFLRNATFDSPAR